MSKVIFIARTLNTNEVSEINQELTKEASTIVYTNLTSIFPFKTSLYDLSAAEKRDINFRVMNDILQFGEISVDGIAISDKLTINGMSIWHYHKFRIYFILRNLSYEDLITRKLKETHDHVVIYSNGPDADMAFQANGSISWRLPQSINKKKRDYVGLLHYLFYFKLLLIKSWFKRKNYLGTRHIILDRALRQPILNIKSLEPELGNYNLEYVYSKAGSDFTIIRELEPPKFINAEPFRFKWWMIRDLQTEASILHGECILIKALFEAKTLTAFKAATKTLDAKLSELLRSATTNQQLWILRRMLQFRKASQFYLFKNLAYTYFFSKKNFNSISTIDENSPAVKCILDAGRNLNIRIFGIQHGNIHILHPAYRFTQNDFERNLICDSTLVWGTYWKEFLKNVSGYPPNRIAITGQARTDIIPKLKDSSQQFKTKFRNNKRFLVVFASQLQQDPLLRERAAADVFEAVKTMNDVHLLVKLHPSETNNPNYYDSIALKTGCSNYSLSTQDDLYQIISASDIIITCFSTVGSEAVYFSKPLIVLDHLEQDIQGYIAVKVAFKATNSSELHSVIRSILEGNLVPDEDALNQYIKANAFSIDGQASDRILGFIRCNS